ncbi:hypothetical protein LG290_16715 (plasmid) [Halomonas sediminis]
MPPPCLRCTATRTLNLETACHLGITSGALIGGAVGAYRAFSSDGTPAPASRFPLAKLPMAIMGASTGGLAGSLAVQRCLSQWMPPGEGTPWLCLSCGYAFRQPTPSVASPS